MPEEPESALPEEDDFDIEPPLPLARSTSGGQRFGALLGRLGGGAAGVIRQTPAAAKRFFFFALGIAVVIAGLAILTGSAFLFALLVRWLWRCW